MLKRGATCVCFRIRSAILFALLRTSARSRGQPCCLSIAEYRDLLAGLASPIFAIAYETGNCLAAFRAISPVATLERAPGRLSSGTGLAGFWSRRLRVGFGLTSNVLAGLLPAGAG